MRITILLFSCLLPVSVFSTNAIPQYQDQNPLIYNTSPNSAFASFLGDHDTALPSKRIAIIGGGSAGSSTAYYLHNYTSLKNYTLNITLFERNPYVGGRSTTVHAFGNESCSSLELGASIFVKVNQNLVAATKALNLSLSSSSSSTTSTGETLGIWNGKSFVLTQPLGGGSWFWKWWSNLKHLWRYGLAPFKASKLMHNTVNQFLRLYNPSHLPFTSLTQAVFDVELTPVTRVTGMQYLYSNDISELFATEVVQAATRVNYAQNIDNIHGLEAMVCLAAEGAMSVKGGNWQIFAGMLNVSATNVVLNTSVTHVHFEPRSESYKLKYVHDTAAREPEDFRLKEAEEEFDMVVLAAPFHQSEIKFSSASDFHIPEDIAYVKLFVTLFASERPLAPSFFGLGPEEAVPSTILTTLPTEDSGASGDQQRGNGPRGIPGPLDFFSISLLKQELNPAYGRKEYIYKIFSPAEVSNSTLLELVGLDGEDGGTTISWTHRKTWLSYPYLTPRYMFDELLLHNSTSGTGKFYYTSGIESFISTMETSSLMGMNIARLISDSFT